VEEVVAALLQVFLEFFVEFLVYVGLDIASYQTERGSTTGCLVLSLFALAGMALGAAVNWIHPHPILPLPWLRLTNLVVGPILAGGLSAAIARWRQREPWVHFWMALCFVLGYNAVRFAYAHA
jgi:hypothetical protein